MRNLEIAIIVLLVCILALHFITGERRAAARHARLKEAMHRLWTDHVHRTYRFIVSALGGLPDTAEVAAHLHENQKQIAAAMARYYGAAFAAKLEALLHEHIDLAAAIVVARKTGDEAAAKAAGDRWYTNSDEIADHLSAANAKWPAAATRTMMRSHLDTTGEFLAARLKGDWAGAEKIHDRVVDQALHMADVLTGGLA